VQFLTSEEDEEDVDDVPVPVREIDVVWIPPADRDEDEDVGKCHPSNDAVLVFRLQEFPCCPARGLQSVRVTDLSMLDNCNLDCNLGNGKFFFVVN